MSKDRVEEPVTVEPYLMFYWDAWKRIRDDRYRDGFGAVGKIYYQTLSCFARDYGLVGQEFEDFIVLLSDEMDDEYLTWVAEQRAIADANKVTPT